MYLLVAMILAIFASSAAAQTGLHGYELSFGAVAMGSMPFGVSDATSTAESIGPITAKKVVKAVSAVSSM